MPAVTARRLSKKPASKKPAAKGASAKKGSAKKALARKPASARPAKSGKPQKFTYFFAPGQTEGNGSMKNLLGGKGANLAAMTSIGLPVPPGFTITTDVCNAYYAGGAVTPRMPRELAPQLDAAVKRLEKITGKKFGDRKAPLLVSVRSGARDSMPGMMDTILNLGLNDETVDALATATGNPRFAWDCYRRFVQMYGDVVMGVQKRHDNEHEPFDTVMDALKHERGVQEDTHLDTGALQELVGRFKALIKERTGSAFPQDPRKQLEGSIVAVFRSWMNDRAIVYRQKYKIPAEWGTAVNVQSMVFGNMGDDSGTGVAFTRDPATGENVLYGEYLINAQGEDVVAGVRTPLPVAEMANDAKIGGAYKQLLKVRKTLEKNFGDVQDFEFTIERKTLYMLQTRNGKRTALAYVKIAHDMVRERLMTADHALASSDPEAMNQLLQPVFERGAYATAQRDGRVLTKGLAAGPGAASGEAVFSPARAVEWAAKGRRVVLCRVETSPEDLRGMIAAEGILTARGGVSSHAALVARQMGKVCVAGAGELSIDYHAGTMTCRGRAVREGDHISINGTTGEVIVGLIPTADSELKQVLIQRTMKPADSAVYGYYAFVMGLADKARTLGLRTNADGPEQTRNAIAFGAEGIGLTRTEHMFFEGDRIDAVRAMILAGDATARAAALADIQVFMRSDFAAMFRVLEGRPACIRLLDPPLHEFLPHTAQQQADLAAKLGIAPERIAERVHALHEANPMLGFRGCRLGIVFPEITIMQARAIFEAAAAVKRSGTPVFPEVMVPLTGFAGEVKDQIALVRREAETIMEREGVRFKYMLGTMIEVPRGALTANEIAKEAEFFSFGTNDLTQTGLGISRDDSNMFMAPYIDKEIFKSNPFESIDQVGVGELVRIACERGRATRPDIKLGVCGEHGGDPASIAFFQACGLNYVSCSPFRLPVARLAAGKAAVMAKRAAAAAAASTSAGAPSAKKSSSKPKRKG